MSVLMLGARGPTDWAPRPCTVDRAHTPLGRSRSQHIRSVCYSTSAKTTPFSLHPSL